MRRRDAQILQFRPRQRVIRPARPVDRLEGLLDWAQREVEGLMPLTRHQRLKLVLTFERVLDAFEKIEDPPEDSA